MNCNIRQARLNVDTNLLQYFYLEMQVFSVFQNNIWVALELDEKVLEEGMVGNRQGYPWISFFLQIGSKNSTLTNYNVLDQ